MTIARVQVHLLPRILKLKLYTNVPERQLGRLGGNIAIDIALQCFALQYRAEVHLRLWCGVRNFHFQALTFTPAILATLANGH